jgi:hypothetical protein
MIRLPVVLTAALLLAGCSGIHTISSAGVPTVDLASLQKDPAKHGFGMDKAGRPRLPTQGLIVKVPKGTRVPMQLNLAVGVATLEPGNNQVLFHRDLLLFISRDGLRVSPDGKLWALIQDVKAIRKLFGLKGRGTIGFGFGIDKEKGAAFHLSVTQGK